METIEAKRQFYAELPRPKDARCCAEEGDDARGVLVDELAARFRGNGIMPKAAAESALIAIEFFQARDRALQSGDLIITKAEARELDELQLQRLSAHAVPRERLIEALSQVWAWPDSRKGVGAMFFALGAPLYGCNSMRALAELRKVSVEDVSNVVDELQRVLGVPRNAMQKSEAAVASYKRENGAPRQSAA